MKTDKLSRYLSHGICPICNKKSNFANGMMIVDDDVKKRIVYCLDCNGSFIEVSETVALEKR